MRSNSMFAPALALAELSCSVSMLALILYYLLTQRIKIHHSARRSRKGKGKKLKIR